MSFFLGTQEQARNSCGKQAISVRATEVLLHICTMFMKNNYTDTI